MKRLLGLTAVVLALLAIPLSHLSMAQPPPRVTMCHLVTSTTHSNGWTTVVGHIIQVPAPAVSAHLGHGDIVFGGPSPGPGACCAFRVAPPR